MPTKQIQLSKLGYQIANLSSRVLSGYLIFVTFHQEGSNNETQSSQREKGSEMLLAVKMIIQLQLSYLHSKMRTMLITQAW